MTSTAAPDWAALARADFPFPTHISVERVAADLSARLTSPDPVARDEQAYTAAARWIRAGHLDTVLTALGDAAADHFTHPDVQARTFAPLVLTCVLTRELAAPGLLPDGAAQRWYTAFTAWYPAEADTRGWDDALGWLHAVAHGADAAAAFGRALPEHRTDLLELCARRMTVRDTDLRYEQTEDARLAHALTELLLTADLTPAQATGWLDTVADAFADAKPGPVPPWAFNTFATLQSLHLHLTVGVADRGTPPHAGPVAARAVDILKGPYRWLA